MKLVYKSKTVELIDWRPGDKVVIEINGKEKLVNAGKVYIQE